MSKPSLFRRFDQFFSREDVPFGLCLVRIILPLLLMLPALQRAGRIRELFSADGSPAPLWENFGQTGLLPIPSPTVAVALYCCLLTSFVTSSIGLFTRTSLLVAMALNVYFSFLDSISTVTKYTMISAHVMLLLSWADTSALWSVDGWLRRNERGPGLIPRLLPRTSPVWPRRLVQIFLGVVYLGAAATKMHTPGFFSGDHMSYWMMTNTNFANPFGEYLSLYPGLIVAMSYITIVWEVSFLFSCWRGTARNYALAIGFVFHFMTYLTLGLTLFPALYIVFYLAFFDEDEYLALRAWLNRIVPRAFAISQETVMWPWRKLDGVLPRWVGVPQAAAALGVFVSTCAVVAVEVERRSDVFGVNRAEGRFVLTPISDSRAKELLRNDQGIQPSDAVASFDVGTETFGETLIDRRSEFRYGDMAIVQCSLEPPHHDVWVEVDLHDSDNHIVARDGAIVPREKLRGCIYCKFDERFTPGQYAFVLKLDGKEITRRDVTLK